MFIVPKFYPALDPVNFFVNSFLKIETYFQAVAIVGALYGVCGFESRHRCIPGWDSNQREAEFLRPVRCQCATPPGPINADISMVKDFYGLKDFYGQRFVWSKICMVKDFNGQRFLWSKISMVKDFYGQRFQWSKISVVKDFCGQRFLWSKISTVKDFYGQRFLWSKISMVLGKPEKVSKC
jgi:predicted enzyme related to lactoylglutathione lyase